MQKTLNLSADVHSQGLSSLDLGGSEGGPGVIELLQPVLNTRQPSFRHGKVRDLDSLLCKVGGFHCTEREHAQMYALG